LLFFFCRADVLWKRFGLGPLKTEQILLDSSPHRHRDTFF
jgi:hypothetical protein